MIADTSIWIDYFRGETGLDLDFFHLCLEEGKIVMAPVVLAELLSAKNLSDEHAQWIQELEFASPSPKFWANSGFLRKTLARQGFAASLADCMVVQSALEHRLPLMSRDKAIQKFAPKVGVLIFNT